MLSFPKKTINLIKNHLLRQKKEVDENLKKVEEDDPVKSPSLAESSEPGTDSYLADSHTKTLVFQQQLKNAAVNIKNSLLKIRRGEYGKCEKCKSQIELGRLLAMPTAQYCVSCSNISVKRR